MTVSWRVANITTRTRSFDCRTTCREYAFTCQLAWVRRDKRHSPTKLLAPRTATVSSMWDGEAGAHSVHQSLVERIVFTEIEPLSILVGRNDDSPAVEFVDRAINLPKTAFHINQRSRADVDEPLRVGLAKSIVCICLKSLQISTASSGVNPKRLRRQAQGLHVDPDSSMRPRRISGSALWRGAKNSFRPRVSRIAGLSLVVNPLDERF